MGVVRRPRTVLAAVAVAAILSCFLLTHFRIDGDLASLMPGDDPTLRLTRHLQGAFPPSRTLLVVLRAESTDALEAAIPDARRRLRESDYLSEVTATRREFAGARAKWSRRAPLTSVPQATLDRLQSRLSGSERKQALQAGVRQMADDPLAGKDVFLRDPLGVRWIFDEASDRLAPELRAGSPWLLVENPPVAFIRAAGGEDSLNIPYSQALVADVRKRLEELPVTTDLSGGYVSTVSHERIMRGDLQRTITLSALLVMLFLSWFTRSLVAPLLLLAPVGLAILCSLAVGGWVLGPLTPLALSVAAILVAQGVDYTIHFYRRFRAERETRERDGALDEAQSSLRRPFFGAAATTIAAFLAMLASQFPGLNQFGVLLAMGILLCLIASLTLFPVLLRVTDRSTRRAPLHVPMALHLAERTSTSGAAKPIAILIGLAGLASWIVVGIGGISVDLNVRNTMAPGDLGLTVLEDLERDLGMSLSPVFALVPRDRPLEETRSAVAALRGEGVIRTSEGLHALLPDGPAVERAGRFRRETKGWVQGTLADLSSIGVRPGPFRKGLDELAAVLAAGPPTDSWLDLQEFSDLKRRIFYRDGGREFHVVTLYVPSAIWEPAQRETFDRAVWARLGADVKLYSAYHLPVHYAAALQSDLILVAGLTAAAILALSAISTGSLPMGLLALLPVLVATGVTLACGALLGGGLNVLNLPAIPVILGVGVDDGIHFVLRHRRNPANAIHDVGPGIWGTTITTLLGFGSIALSSTPGLSSLGILVAVGATTAFVTTVFLLPALLPKPLRAKETGR